MSNDPVLSSDDSSGLERSIELMQRFFDDAMLQDEAAMLLSFWERSPEVKTFAKECYFTEKLFQFLQDSNAVLAPDRLEELKTLALARYGSTPACPMLLDTDELVRLAAGSPSLPKPEQKIGIDPFAPSLGDHQVAESYGKIVPYDPKKNKSRLSPGLILLSSFVVLAALVFYEFGGFFPDAPKGKSDFHPLARVSAVVDPVWQNETEVFKPGQQLESARLRLESGLVELELKNGVRLALEGPIDFKINTAMRTFCGLGRLSASVPKQGKGFTVSTPFNDVTDLGTEFYLDVEDEKVQIHTINGLVSLGKLPNNTTKDLSGGSAFSIDTQGITKDFPAEPSLFQDDKAVQKRFHAVQQRELAAWEEKSAAYRNDPGLLLLFDFEESGKTVTNRARQANESGNGSLVGARRTTGRWKSKNAVAFHSKRSAIDLRIPQELRSLTLVASIKVDALDRYVHRLLSSNEEHQGSLFWQLGGDGVLTLAVQSRSNVQAAKYPSSVILPPKRWGAWYRLATVLDADAGTVSHYLDDNLVSVLTMEESVPIRIGDAQIGNGKRSGNTPVDRSFNGRIDEFMIFNRALAPAELASLFNTLPK